MNKENYKTKLCGVRDKINGTIQVIGHAETLGGFTRAVIPSMNKGGIPLNDLEIVELGEINVFTGKIEPIEEVKAYEWNELYNFHVTGKAVKDESETVEESEER